MSSVDERIVQMRFDNKQFESGVQTSIKSLGNLKQGLNLGDASKSLSELDRVGKSFSLAGISNGVESIKNSFSTLGIVGMTAISNIANSAVNAGKTMVSALTIDPVKMGFQEYETKMGAIQTILTNTASKGTTLDDVNAALNELNLYSDQTIYNFAEMTKNIGTFTAAGVDLNTSTMAIKGIANLAAGSGSTAEQASTAMYQLSQAIAAGKVGLQDWNSVVNAGMGGELFQKALRQTGKELGKDTADALSFRDSINSEDGTGWLTADVLLKTLEKFSKDESLTKAATQVKTFTQLFDTMKESVQSGWAQTWETIIGNKDESAAMLTSINNVFSSLAGASANARNEMMSFWKANGGRDKSIDTISSAFNTLMSVLKPVHEAFREVFPAMTGERLVQITEKIHSLVTGFKLTDTTIANIKSTFKGLFAALDIAKQAFMAIGTTVFNVIGKLAPAGDGLLSITASIGEFIVALDNSIKSSGIFYTVFGKIGDAVLFVIGTFKMAGDLIQQTFSKITGIDLSGFDAISSKLGSVFQPLTGIPAIFDSVINKIKEVAGKIAPIFDSIGAAISPVFEKIKSDIANAFGGENTSILDIINGGLLAGILLGVRSFIKSLTSITDGANGFLEGVTNILDGVSNSLQSFQANLKAGILLKIAIAIGILAASLVVLSTINQEKLTSSLAAMSAMFVELFGSMAAFEKIMAGSGFKSMTRISLGMIGLATAVLILSVAMTKLAKLDWEGIDKGLIAVAALCAILVKSAKSLSMGTKGLITTSIGLVIFAEAINLLVNAVEKLGAIDTDKLMKGLMGVGALVLELSIFMKLTSSTSLSVSEGAGILLIAVALNLMASAVEKIGSISIETLAKGLGSIAIILGEIALFARLTSEVTNLTSTALGLAVISVSILLLATAVEKMGNLSWDQIGKGLFTMATMLAVLISAIGLIPENIGVQALSILAIAVALNVLAMALLLMGNMSWEQIGKGLATMAGGLTILTIAMNFMETGLAGAAAALIMAGALALLTPSLVILGSLSWSQIAKGLITLVGVFAIMGVSAVVLGPLVPVILALSAAIALFGVGCLAVGAGVLAFSAGLTALVAIFAGGGAVIFQIIAQLIAVIPTILAAIGTGIVQFAAAIGAGAPIIADAVVQILVAIMDTINVVAPKLVTCLCILLDSLLNAVVIMIPMMVDAAMRLILGMLEGIANNIAAVTAAGIDIILQFIAGVASKIPDIIDMAFKVVISFINGLADAIRNNNDAINSAMWNLVSAIIESIGGFMGSLVDVGKNIVGGFIQGIKSMAGALVDAASGVISGAVDGVKDLLGIHSPSRVFAEIGKYSALDFVDGLNNYSGAVTSATEDIGKSAVDALGNVSSRIADAVTNDYNPTITPVLDLNNITTGAGQIDSMLNRNTGINVSSINNKASLVSDNIKPITNKNQNGGYDASVLDSVKEVVKSEINNNQSNVDLSGTLTVEVTNNNGEIIGIAQKAIKDLLREESR